MKDNEIDLSKLPIHFIIGSGRSGPTLLMMLLNHSKGIAATPEVKHVLYFRKKFNRNSGTVDSKNVLRYFDKVKESVSNPLNYFDTQDISNTLRDYKFKDYASFSKSLHLNLHRKLAEETHAIFDKNNLYSFYLSELSDIVPEAKYCICLRDYRGFIASNLKSQHAFKENKSVVFFAYAWRKYATVCLNWQSSHPDKSFLLRYEDFVAEPTKEMERLSNFFNVPFDPACISYRDNIIEKVRAYSQKEQIDQRILKKIQDLTEPIHVNAIGSWQNSLTKTQLEKIEFVCGKMGLKLDYHPKTQLSTLKKIYFTLTFFPIKWRVDIFFALKSLKLHHYLHVIKRAKYNKQHNFTT